MFIRTVRIAAQQQKRGGLKIWRCQGVACVKVRHIFSWFFAAFWSSKKQKKLNHSIHVTFFKKKLPKPARHVKAGNKGGKTCQNTCFSAWPRAGRKNCRGDSRSILPGSVTPTVSAKQVTGWLRADPALQTVILSLKMAVASRAFRQAQCITSDIAVASRASATALIKINFRWIISKRNVILYR